MRSIVIASFLVLCALQPAESGQTNQSPHCTAERLVGTWKRISLLRNALSVQPPDAPLFETFFTRKHVDDVNPNLVGSEESGQFSVDGDLMTLRGSTRTGAKVDARYQRRKPMGTTTSR
jgi:hypothetical protein